MGYFEGMRNSQVGEDRNRLATNGVYRLQIVRTYVKETREYGPAFIAKFKVLGSTSEKNPVGATADWYQSLQNKDAAFGDLKRFFIACAGKDPVKDKEWVENELNPVIEKEMQEAVEKNTLEGIVVECRTHDYLTQKRKVTIIRHTFAATSQK